MLNCLFKDTFLQVVQLAIFFIGLLLDSSHQHGTDLRMFLCQCLGDLFKIQGESGEAVKGNAGSAHAKD